MDALKSELQQRWRSMFAALAAGDDVSPTMRLRTEGLMEAIVFSGNASQESILDAMEASYEEAFGKTIVDSFGEQWREFFPFPQIPAMGKRAPVHPSTKD